MPPLDTPVQYLKGIGPRRSDALRTVGVTTVRDLLLYVPRRYLDRTTVVTIEELRRSAGVPAPDEDEIRRDVTVVGEVRSFRVAGFGRKARFVLVLADQSGSMQCVWFGGVQYWRKAFEVGEILAVSGQPTFYGSVLQFVHPALDRLKRRLSGEDAELEDVDWSRTLHTGGLIPLYPSGQELERVGLDSSGFRRVIASALRTHLEALTETLPGSLLERHRFLPLPQAVAAVHFPKTREDLQESRRRLKYEEFFFFQLLLALKRHSRRDEEGISFDVESRLARRLVDALPFRLTRAQVRAIREITGDMKDPRPLNRLLQGDVGSGKTVVALLCMLIAVDNGYQAALMAPTEILAEQHARTLTRLLGDIPVSIRLLIGGQRSRVRQDVLKEVRRGGAGIVVGTHALFEKGVDFARLGLVVIDEQHRFGVMQRALLRGKGSHPDVLVMTATPIPRTLSLTLYGDLDLSVIDELPHGRKPITTRVMGEKEKGSAFDFVRRQVAEGRQAYLVYPLIEESEKVALKAATAHFEMLRHQVFPELRLGLIHGRMAGEEKDRVMGEFTSGAIQILVATTVIEVGIDVPNATVMVIENAERFGLAQLHQLRGRVGRGGEQSFCLLLTENWIAGRVRKGGGVSGVATEDADERRRAVARLTTLAATTDGFRIAEKDLELRGPGDFLGTRQSGMPEFRIADLIDDASLLDTARGDAFAIVDRDPALALPEHRPLSSHLRAAYQPALALLHVG